MSIIKDGIESHKGCVIKVWEHYWMDGMCDEFADVWNSEEHKVETIQIGYYGCDGCNLYGNMRAVADLSEENRRDIIRTLKRNDALAAYSRSVTAHKTEIRKGTHAEVIRGRKIAKGTKVEVFWVGDKETYKSRQYAWMYETERIAGCYDEDGNKLWIKAEYLKSTDSIKSPNAKERKAFIKAYVKKALIDMGIR